MADDKGKDPRTSVNDGYSKERSLQEGHIRKGGTNAATSQVQARPPAPAPIPPTSRPGGTDKK